MSRFYTMRSEQLFDTIKSIKAGHARHLLGSWKSFENHIFYSLVSQEPKPKVTFRSTFPDSAQMSIVPKYQTRFLRSWYGSDKCPEIPF